MLQTRPAPGPHPRRVALYSHDTQGLGHIRRNIAVASAIVAAFPHTDILLLSGNPEATQLPLPPNTDIVTLPTIAKDRGGRYRSRTLHSPLDVVVNIRSAVVEAALTSFCPDLLIVDKVPLGLEYELQPALVTLRHRYPTRTVLGLREILDDPVTTAAEWQATDTSAAIADYYDQVWVYGDRQVFDPVAAYGLPPKVAGKIIYTGYLSEGRGTVIRSRRRGPVPPADPYVLCMVGGGQDGFELAEAFVATGLPPQHRGIVLTGPFMAEQHRALLRRRARANPGITVWDFVPNTDAFLAGAGAVISMAGYNSVCETLALATATLLVPRTRPRTEQLIRAQRLSELGFADLLLPEELTPGALEDWLANAVQRRLAHRPRIDLAGLHRIPGLAFRLVEQVHHAA